LTNKIKVLVVDDSLLFQRLISSILSEEPDIDVVGVASDPYDAREKIKQLKPDVITLDIEMPKMDGITFLSNLMRLNPIPTIMISSLTDKGAAATLKCLEIGAIDYVLKKTNPSDNDISALKQSTVRAVKCAAKVNVKKILQSPLQGANQVTPQKTDLNFADDSLIAIGASTGGVPALEQVLSSYYDQLPPIVIVQHIPKSFSLSLANRLNKKYSFGVHHAENGMPIKKGNVYIARGDSQLAILKNDSGYICRVCDDKPMHHHKPSVSYMFFSLSKLDARNMYSVILTGMGNDGADGMKSLRDNGAHTIIQDKDTSVVWGMPRVAYEMGAAKDVLPLSDILPTIINSLGK